MKKDLAINQFLHYSLGMSNTYLASEVSPEEYAATLAEAAELALADDSHDSYQPDEESDELRAREDADYWASLHEREDDPEDRYLDSHWEDVNEYGMEGCCGDF